MTRDARIYAAFTMSGIAGLVYEVVWSRYLGLYVGHSAYAQVLVLAVYLGGMAVGALVVSDISKRVTRPLLWYVGAELILAAFGLLFHPVFLFTADVSYDVVFPALASASLVGGVRWGIAGLILLPQAMVLGATFPFMAAGLVRRDSEHPGYAVALAYLLNTLGGATGVLLAGFWLIGAVGLPGTVASAAGLNTLAAGLAWLALRAGGEAREPPGSRDGPLVEPGGTGAPPDFGAPHTQLWRVLLVIAFGTALASFAYEIAWIRMLSLVLGSATHSFELMLSAFILGLAVGAWVVRKAVDRSPDPARLLGRVQLAMGLAALASLPLYLLTFSWMSALVTELPGTPAGYALFNVSRYGLCLLVMLPATVLAGMTLPVITGTLLRAGHGERSIGAVYGVNTIGSVVGAGLAGLVALPLLGLEGLVVAGAGLDMALGVWVLERSAAWSGRRRARVAAAALATVSAAAVVALTVRLEPALLTSGVFRYGQLPDPADRELLFYRHGRTATVSVHVHAENPVVVLSTNGKPDASLGPRWFREEDPDTMPPVPIEEQRDYTVQALAPLVGLGYAPHASRVAAIGHGSGMSGVAFLTSPSVESLVTIEIEPQMVEGSTVMLPVNEAVFNDPRSSFVFDDAKSYFAYERESYDIVFAEPSNPWVSGIAGLFSSEFYERLRPVIAPGGVLVQWINLYELNDDLFLSILAALDTAFPHYRAYLVGDADVVVVAGAEPLPEPDWSVMDSRRVGTLLRGVPPITARHMRSLLLFDQETFAPVLARGVEANSDFRPRLDLGAERARFERTMAEGVFSFAIDRIDLQAAWNEERRPPMEYDLVPARGLRPLVDWGRAAWVRESVDQGGGLAPIQFPEWTDALVELGDFYQQMQADDWVIGPESPAWTARFLRVESSLHLGTSGWADTTFYATVFDFLDRAEGRPEARAVVDLLYGVNTFDWERTAEAADLLIGRVVAGEPWVTPTLLQDAAVLAYGKTGRAADARNVIQLLKPRTRRASWNLRDRLLEALAERAAPDA